jgi:hypothetical protein
MSPDVVAPGGNISGNDRTWTGWNPTGKLDVARAASVRAPFSLAV